MESMMYVPQAVVARAVGESLLGMPLGPPLRTQTLGSYAEPGTRRDAVLHRSHIRKALKDVLPRATQMHSFLR